VFPALALTGLWMWQGPRLTRAVRRWRAGRHAEPRSGTRPAGRLDGDSGAASRRSLALLAAATLTGLLHHADHVLRADHSGWPFTPEVTALTPSLLAYALLYGAYHYRARPRVGAALVGALLVFTQAAHVVVETPHQQYDVWATGVSHLPHAYGQPNLLHLASPALGVAAAAVSILLSALLLATALSLLADARRTGGAALGSAGRGWLPERGVGGAPSGVNRCRASRSTGTCDETSRAQPGRPTSHRLRERPASRRMERARAAPAAAGRARAPAEMAGAARARRHLLRAAHRLPVALGCAHRCPASTHPGRPCTPTCGAVAWPACGSGSTRTCSPRCGRETAATPRPARGVIDSQSAKTTEEGGPRGYGGAKKLAGRKRHILVDTGGC
jgi:hypothetical protein